LGVVVCFIPRMIFIFPHYIVSNPSIALSHAENIETVYVTNKKKIRIRRKKEDEY